MPTPIHGGDVYIIDPFDDLRLYDGVRTRRMFAFLVDVILIAILTFAVGVLITILGVLTFGLGWLLYPLIWPGVALLYSAFTMGGPQSATPGMRSQGIEARFLGGDRLNPGIAAIHAVLFYASVSLLTPLVLVVSLFNERKRLLHDMLLGVVIVNRF